jgi:hypothetical protein
MSAGIFALLAGVVPARADVSEYTVKAAYLYNFANFVTWPPGVFSAAGTPLVIGVVGDDPFGDALDTAVNGKSAGGHPLKVKRFSSFEAAGAPALKKCQILFICYSEKDRVSSILSAVKGSNVLTVSEIEGFSYKGGILLFDMVGSKISLVANTGAAKKAGLMISSKLLQICKIYEGN